MSYDFSLFQCPTGIEPLVAARIADEKTSWDQIDPGPATAAKEATKQSLLNVLLAQNSSLSVFEIKHEEIAKFEGITLEQAKIRYRYIEINSPHHGNGIQIHIFDDEASLTVPYWHKGEIAARTFEEIWKYLQVMQSVTGYSIYDPQLDRIIKSSSDMEDALRRYLGVIQRIGV